MKQARLLSLDALRGVAAIAVLFHHAERELHLGVGFGFNYGYLAVDVFFLMSGFVIAHAYEPRMDARMGLTHFMKLRLQRLYPMMLLGAVLGIAVAAWHGASGGSFLLTSISALIMLPLVWSGPVLFPINIPEWSIFFEIVANALHRLLAPVLTLRLLVTILILSLVMLGVAGWRLHGLANGFSPETFWGGFPRTFFSYFTGVFLYRTQSRWQGRMPTLPLPLLLIAFLAVVLGEAMLGGRVPASAYWAAAVIVVFPVGLMLLAQARVAPSFARIAEALGELSFPLYAVHMPLLLIVAPVILPLGLPLRFFAAIGVVLAVMAISLALAYAYDRPVRKLFAGRRKPIVPSAEAEIAAP